MPGPQVPASAGEPVLPPIANSPFVNSFGYLSATGLRWAQMIWAGVFGGGGVVDSIIISNSQTVGVVQAAVESRFAEIDQSQPLIGRIAALEGRLALMEAAGPPPLRMLVSPLSPSAVKWVPTIAGSTTAGTQTYGVQVGEYIEAGPLVIATFAMTLTALDAATAGNVTIAGLPFLSNNLANLAFGVAWSRWGNITLAAGATELTGSLGPSSKVINVLQSTTAAASAPLAVTGLSATTDLAGTIAYFR